MGARELASDGHVVSGSLTCRECGASYPIVEGIPRFAPLALPVDVQATVDGFSYEWEFSNRVTQDTRFGSLETFLDFIYPVQPHYLKGKIVLDAGCGAGRFIPCAHRVGARTIVGVDLSDSVIVAFENTRDLDNVFVLQADLLSLPFRRCFDYVFSVGVLGFTGAPSRAFEAIASLVKTPGGISAWVYSKENNDWITKYLNPIRSSFTSKVPRSILMALSYLATVPLFLASRLIYRPVSRNRRLGFLRDYLFYFDYIDFLADYSHHSTAVTVFDHLHPAISEYISHDEFAGWFKANRLQNVVITARNRNSWRGFGEYL